MATKTNLLNDEVRAVVHIVNGPGTKNPDVVHILTETNHYQIPDMICTSVEMLAEQNPTRFNESKPIHEVIREHGDTSHYLVHVTAPAEQLHFILGNVMMVTSRFCQMISGSEEVEGHNQKSQSNFISPDNLQDIKERFDIKLDTTDFDFTP